MYRSWGSLWGWLNPPHFLHRHSWDLCKMGEEKLLGTSPSPWIAQWSALGSRQNVPKYFNNVMWQILSHSNTATPSHTSLSLISHPYKTLQNSNQTQIWDKCERSTITSSPGRVTSIVMSMFVCLSVCLSVHSHIAEVTCWILLNFMFVECGRGLVLL